MTTTSTTRWGAAELPSTVCPIPTAHTPESALKAYLKAKDKMPGLTPAAWRKQAAIDMGLDYNTYLALWKVHKGAAKALKMVPESTPTVPAAVSQTKTMGVKAASPRMTQEQLKLAIDIDSFEDPSMKLWDDGADHFNLQFNDDLYGSVAMDIAETLDAGGMSYTKSKISHIVGNKKVNITTFKIPKVQTPVSGKMTAQVVGKTTWKPTTAPTPTQVAQVKDAYEKGIISGDEALEWYDKFQAKVTPGSVLDDVLGKYILQTKASSPNTFTTVKASVSKKAAASPTSSAVIQTSHGPLTHDLAQSVYKKVKKDMPGATPAVWRKAAAEYLGVDYNDYLKAWKKPTTPAQKAAQTPASKLPPSNHVPLSPSTKGKYANKNGITSDELKDELVKLYGPGAQKQYISLDYNDAVGNWYVQFPKSILPTTQSQMAVVEGLKKLGLLVEKKGSVWSIKTPKSAKVASKNADQIKQTGTYTSPDGKVLLDMASADRWTDSWWRTLTEAEKKSWKHYTGSGYRTINDALRRGGSSRHEAILKRTMMALEHEITVFRGTSIPISEFKVGGKWRDKGFMSSAINPGSAWEGIKFEITMPKKSKGMFIGQKSSHPHENEFLIDSRTEFRVIEVDTLNQRVRMVAIPH